MLRNPLTDSASVAHETLAQASSAVVEGNAQGYRSYLYKGGNLALNVDILWHLISFEGGSLWGTIVGEYLRRQSKRLQRRR